MKVLFALSNRREAHMASRLTQGLEAAEVTFLLLDELAAGAIDERAFTVVRDVELYMMSAQHFDVLITFTGEWTQEAPAHFALIQCFNEIGVPTIEVQSGIFQHGRWAADISPARQVVAWRGDKGIGYPWPESPTLGEPYFIDKYVLIAVGDDWRGCDEEGRHVFGIAIAKLVQTYSETQFVWKLNNQDDYGQDLVEMVRGYQFDNLSFEDERPLQDLIANADGVIATLSTALVDIQLAQKPALVFLSESEKLQGMAEGLSIESFQRAPELLNRWQEFVERRESFRVDTGAHLFAPGHFAEQVSLAATAKSIKPERTRLALEFTALRRSLLAPELARLSNRTVELQVDVERIEKALLELSSSVRAPAERVVPHGTTDTPSPEELELVRGQQNSNASTFGNSKSLIARYKALLQSKL